MTRQQQISYSATAQFAREVQKGLCSSPKWLPTRFIYDDNGSSLFEKIMLLPEYYPARKEKEILTANAHKIAARLPGQDFNIVELGAGNGEKSLILLNAFYDEKTAFSYVPVDISEQALAQLGKKITKHIQSLDLHPMHCEYFEGLQSLSSERKNLVLFLGGNIGNFTPDERLHFLQSTRKSLKNGDLLLMGIDLKKDPAILCRAYDDTQGITAKFNKNLLLRINRELGGNFDPDEFLFHPIYYPVSGAVESYLLSTREQEVYIKHLDMTCTFDFLEPIHTESSYKFTPEEILSLADASGFKPKVQFYDEENYFTEVLWEA